VATQQDGSKAKKDLDRPVWYWPLLFALALLLVNFTVAWVLVRSVNALDRTRFLPEITIAMVLIIGVIGLVSVMALLVVVFRHYDPSGRTARAPPTARRSR